MISLRFQADREATLHLHEIAGERLASDLRFEPLEPFRTGSPLAGSALTVPPLVPREQIYRGPGWLGGRWRPVEAWSGDGGVLLRVEGAGDYAVLDGGSVIRASSAPEEPLRGEAAQLAVEIALGPALLLQLARRNLFALHASAIERVGLVIAFAGESGAGKSTLTARLAEAPGVRRVADDLVPIHWAEELPRVAAHFPQLKLSPSEQYPLSAPSSLPLAAVCVLEPTLAQVPASLEPMARREATLALVQHTVAGRILPTTPQKRLFEQLSQTTGALPVFRLVYPHKPGSPTQILDLLSERFR